MSGDHPEEDFVPYRSRQQRRRARRKQRELSEALDFFGEHRAEMQSSDTHIQGLKVLLAFSAWRCCCTYRECFGEQRLLPAPACSGTTGPQPPQATKATQQRPCATPGTAQGTAAAEETRGCFQGDGARVDSRLDAATKNPDATSTPDGKDGAAAVAGAGDDRAASGCDAWDNAGHRGSSGDTGLPPGRAPERPSPKLVQPGAGLRRQCAEFVSE